MAEVSPEAKSYVEKLTSGPMSRPEVLKEICMDLLMMNVQNAGIVRYLVDSSALSPEARKEVDRLQDAIGARMDSMIEALIRLERGANG